LATGEGRGKRRLKRTGDLLWAPLGEALKKLGKKRVGREKRYHRSKKQKGKGGELIRNGTTQNQEIASKRKQGGRAKRT